MDKDTEERIVALAFSFGFEPTPGEDLTELLDQLVHEAKACEASKLNNDGVDSQLEFLEEWK